MLQPEVEIGFVFRFWSVADSDSGAAKALDVIGAEEVAPGETFSEAAERLEALLPVGEFGFF